jgi:hypothetical protein
MATLVPFPDFEMTDDAEESLMNFYMALGWDGEQQLIVQNVKICKETWLTLCQYFIDLDAGLFYFNYSPSKDDRVPPNKGKFWNGWIQP